MTRYLISFDDGAMTFPEEELPDVAKAAHAVVQEAKDAGVWVFGGGLENQQASVVATDGTVTDGPYPETKEVLGGVRGRRRALTRGGAGVGCQDRRRLPVCARGTGAPARPDRLIEGDPPLRGTDAASQHAADKQHYVKLFVRTAAPRLLKAVGLPGRFETDLQRCLRENTRNAAVQGVA